MAFDEAGKPLRMFGVAQDITERKRAEDALQSRSRQQQAVAELSRRALERSDLATLLDDVVAVVPQVVGVEFCNVFEFKIRCRFDCGQPVLIQDNAIATHLYRIAQEAIHNAIKHGHATNVSITLESSDDRPALTILDDGAGLPAESSSTQGMGLRIMSYRAGMIGGHLSVGRARGKGTKVLCTWKI